MLDSILGLPVHPLIVHATVVTVPVAALCVILAALWPRFRRWIGWGPFAFAALALVLYPLTTQSGESLEHRLGHSAAIERHSELADGLLPWLIGLAVAALGLLAWRYSGSRLTGGREIPNWWRGLVLVLSLVAGVGTIIWVVLVGHSGAEAVWTNQ